jgi:hypothetical protein
VWLALAAAPNLRAAEFVGRLLAGVGVPVVVDHPGFDRVLVEVVPAERLAMIDPAQVAVQASQQPIAPVLGDATTLDFRHTWPTKLFYRA